MSKTFVPSQSARSRRVTPVPRSGVWKRVLSALIAVGILSAAGFWAWQKLFPPDEAVLRRRLDELAQAASFGASEKPLSRLANASQLAGFFTADVVLKLHGIGSEEGGFKGRDRVQELALAVRREGQWLKVEFLTPEVTVDRGTGAAVVQTAVRAQTGDQTEPFMQLLKMDWRKEDGKWLVARVATVEALRRLPSSVEGRSQP